MMTQFSGGWREVLVSMILNTHILSFLTEVREHARLRGCD